MQATVSPKDLAALTAGLGLPAGAEGGPRVQSTPLPGAEAPADEVDLVFAGPVVPGVVTPEAGARELRAAFSERLDPAGAVLIAFGGREEDSTLARWRNELWPWLHAVGVCRSSQSRSVLETMQGARPLEGSAVPFGTVLCLRRREQVLSPEATVVKFDQNAAGWNGSPGSPGYPHHRWMRRLVALYHRADPGRILDFGCGAGWVGIEAALRAPTAELCFFDPSPEMVRHAAENARTAGIGRAEGRVGFGEDPPFPGPGEAPFDLVLSSGVVSFSPDFERWFDGIERAVAPGGTLVIGDIHRESRGFQKRRNRKPLLPVREMNALTRAEARAELERRGFEMVRHSGYQLTWPIPQAMHWSEQRGRGFLSPPLLVANRLAAGLDRALGSPLQGQFDSWMMELSKRG